MTGATIIFSPQLADLLLEKLPAVKPGLTGKELHPSFPTIDRTTVWRTLARLYKHRIVGRCLVPRGKGRSEYAYWRLP